MITSVVKRSIITTVTAAVVLVGSLIYAGLVLRPEMGRLRQIIDDRRASIIVSEQEQSNLEALSKNIADIQSQQQRLNEHIWSFAVEEQFFSLWATMAVANNVIIDQPKVAEVTPTNQPVSRAVTIVVAGTITNVMATIDAIQRLDPLVVIERLAIKNGTANEIVATIEAQTLWQ